MPAKLKHLEFIQAVVTRMNTNSFLIKGWTVTITAALFALAARDADRRVAYVAWFVIPVFWVLDGFYLDMERRYRRLYDRVRVLPPDAIDFDMRAPALPGWRANWVAAIFSRTLLIFYGALLIATLAITLILSR